MDVCVVLELTVPRVRRGAGLWSRGSLTSLRNVRLSAPCLEVM